MQSEKVVQLGEVITTKTTQIETITFTCNQKEREKNELQQKLADYDEIKRQNDQYKRDIH